MTDPRRSRAPPPNANLWARQALGKLDPPGADQTLWDSNVAASGSCVAAYNMPFHMLATLALAIAIAGACSMATTAPPGPASQAKHHYQRR